MKTHDRRSHLLCLVVAALAALGAAGCSDNIQPAVEGSPDAIESSPDAQTSDAVADDDAIESLPDAQPLDAIPTEDAVASDVSPGEDAAPALTNWHQHIRPLVEHHCTSCHQEGAVGGFPLNDYDAILGIRPIMVGRVLSGEMPPWPMDPSCREVQDARYMTSDEKALFESWRREGYLRGDPDDYRAIPARTADHAPTRPADLKLTRSEAYTADRALGDDYRCFVYDQEVLDDTWVSGANVLPDALAVAHHVLVYVVPPNQVARVRQHDAAAPGVGYPCVGGVGAQGTEALLAGWVPGMLPMHFHDDSALLVTAGSKFVIQMHFNTLNIPASEPIPADSTQVELWTLPSGAEPQRRVQIQALYDADLRIKANESRVVEGATFTSPASAMILGVIPHMHLLGRSISLHIERSLTPDDVCLANIPVWDFHWQQVYQYKQADQVPLYFGDKLVLECIYDNSAANQAVINGVKQTPRYVTWGEGTLDEMCLVYLVTSEPWGGAAAGLCPGASDCIRACAPEDALCPVLCMSLAGNDCASCATTPLFTGCGEKECPLPLAGLGACISGCPTPDDALGCAVNTCRPELDTLYACLEGPMRAGACDSFLKRCDIAIGSGD